jgi:hypothetical protein
MSRFADDSDEELLSKICVFHDRSGTDHADLLLCLIEVKCRRLHLAHGYRSIYKFLKKRFGLTDKQAYTRSRAAEAIELEPQAEHAVREGRVSMSQLAQGMKAIYQEGKRLRNSGQPSVQRRERIDLIRDILKSREANETIAQHFPELIKDHSIERPISATLTQFSMAATKSEVAIIQRVRELLSSKIIDGSWHDLVMELAEFFLSKKDPLRRKGRKAAEEPTTKQRGYISLAIQQALLTRSGGQCEFVAEVSRVRCDARTNLQRDHIVAVAFGGTDELSNFRLYCAEHNRFAAFCDSLEFLP